MKGLAFKRPPKSHPFVGDIEKVFCVKNYQKIFNVWESSCINRSPEAILETEDLLNIVWTQKTFSEALLDTEDFLRSSAGYRRLSETLLDTENLLKVFWTQMTH